MSTRTWLDSKGTKPSMSTPIKLNNEFKIGDQVTVNQLLGTIKFIGTTHFKAGTWIGIQLDKLGAGKNNGSIEGKCYFVCPPKTGLFILASKLSKQQHTHHRPSTPYQTNNKKLSTPPTMPPTVDIWERMKSLELENKQLKAALQEDSSKYEKLEKKMNQLRLTSVNSIEIVEKMLQSQYEKVQLLQIKNNALISEMAKLEKTSLEAAQRWQKEKAHYGECIQRYFRDMAVLESILVHKEEKKKLTLDIHKIKWSTSTCLDTPIEEEQQEICSLCNKKGHELLQCPIVNK